MKKLFQLAFSQRNYKILIGFILLAACFLTFASQLEMFAVGTITRKGPDFFELFAPIKNGELAKVDQISKEQVISRLEEIENDKGEVTRKSASHFLVEHQGGGAVQKGINFFNRFFPITENIRNLAFFLVFVALFKAIALFIHRFMTKILSILISRDLRQAYFEHIQTLSMGFYQDHNIGSLSSRVVGDSALIAEAINSFISNYFQAPFTIVTTLLICFFTSWQLSLIIFLGFPLLLFPILFLAKRVKRIARQIQQSQEKFASVIIDFLSGIQTVKIFAMEEFSLKKYKEHNHFMAKLERKSARYDLMTRPIVHTIGMFFLATTILYGLYVVQLSVSEVLFFGGLLFLFYESIKQFAEENNRIQRGIAAAERMFEVLELKPLIQDVPDASTFDAFNQALEFKDVWFKYEEQWVLKGVSFRIQKGETVAIVGPTGSGKSTIVQLIPRLYDIHQGSILIDGKCIKTFTQKSLREKVAFVPQKPFLFLDTIAANIGFGRQFTIEQVQEAAIKAHAHEFISQLPKGYKTELLDAGKNLSGGQQQRLAIARALVKQAPILVMDEATSALDNVSENHIKQAIHQLRRNVTQIIIAHRLSTIEDADRIIYIDNGHKIAEGTKDELLKDCPGFKLMWEMMHKKG